MKRLKHWKKENKRTPQAAPTPAPAPQKTGLSTQKTADICAAASTHIGRRAYQQDCYCIPSDTSGGAFLCVLCDGMGGMESGELASQTAANALTAAFEKAGRKVEKPFEFLEKNILEIDRTVHQLTDAHGNPLRSGTTLLAAIADADKLYWASVGDSRIYLLHGGQLRQLTRDQNYGEVLLQQLLTGKISIEEANADPQKDALTHFVGIGDLNNINMPAAAQPLGADDIVLLCSDGLYRSLEEEEMQKPDVPGQHDRCFAAPRPIGRRPGCAGAKDHKACPGKTGQNTAPAGSQRTGKIGTNAAGRPGGRTKRKTGRHRRKATRHKRGTARAKRS